MIFHDLIYNLYTIKKKKEKNNDTLGVLMTQGMLK